MAIKVILLNSIFMIIKQLEQIFLQDWAMVTISDIPNHSDEKDWDIVFVDTGEETLKGGRLKQVEQYIQGDLFHLTYGDGVCDVNINKLLDFHDSHNCIGSVTAVRPPSRFGELRIDEVNMVQELEEKAANG